MYSFMEVLVNLELYTCLHQHLPPLLISWDTPPKYLVVVQASMIQIDLSLWVLQSPPGS